MRVQTLSIVCGTTACNAKCPFCVSKMTDKMGMSAKPQAVNYTNLDTAIHLAQVAGVTTAMITGKGEPTLWPILVNTFLERLHGKIPLLELQTNGIRFADPEFVKTYLPLWRKHGLTTVSVSMVHPDPDRNNEIYGQPTPVSIEAVVEVLHSYGFSVRLTCIMNRGYIDDTFRMGQVIDFARLREVEQLTFMPVTKARRCESLEVRDWVNQHVLHQEDLGLMREYLQSSGMQLMTLPHGAIVYDVGGQNVCLSNCLKPSPSMDELRNLIFFPDGHLRYDWQYSGAILL